MKVCLVVVAMVESLAVGMVVDSAVWSVVEMVEPMDESEVVYLVES